MGICKRIYLAEPNGICSGVASALNKVELVLKENPNKTIYVFHEIVHNTRVVNDLKSRNVLFVSEIAEIPRNEIVIFSAHGVSRDVEEQAMKRDLQIVDATCPLVKKLHYAAENNAETLIIVGHSGHVEVEGILGRGKHLQKCVINTIEEAESITLNYPNKPILLLAQTTFNKEEYSIISEILKKRFAHIECGAGVCYATEMRQNAVRKVAKKSEITLIVGSPKSSNSNRLCEIAREENSEAFLIESFADIPLDKVCKLNSVALGAGASAPEILLKEVLSYLKTYNFSQIIK